MLSDFLKSWDRKYGDPLRTELAAYVGGTAFLLPLFAVWLLVTRPRALRRRRDFFDQFVAKAKSGGVALTYSSSKPVQLEDVKA